MNNSNQVRRFIFTGTPGSGKTSVIVELEKLGYIVIHEAATDVIKLEQAKGIERPWDCIDFTNKVTRMQKERQTNTKGDLQFYDRSPFCTYALGKYLSHWKNIEFVPSPILLDEINRCLKSSIYQNKIFFCENLGFIEHTDVRKISYEDVLLFEQIHLNVYKEFGFEIVLLSKQLVAERCRFVLTASNILK